MPLYTKHDLDKQQVRAIKRGLEESVAIFGDLGTGKTIVSLYIAKRLMELGFAQNALVVSTIRCIYSTWEQEAGEWKYTKDLQFNVLHGPEKRGRFYNKADIHLVNWDGMPWLADMIRAQGIKGKAFPFDMLFLDESTKIKDWKTSRFKKWKMLQREFSRRYLLTATPRPNSDLDLWAQFYMLDGGETLGTGITAYKNKYFQSFVPHVWEPKPGASEEINRLIAPKVVRMVDTREQRHPERDRMRVELGKELMEQYKEFEKEYFLQLESGEIEVFNAISLAIKLRQFVQGGMYSPTDADGNRKTHIIHTKKLEALAELLDLYPDENILCPIQFRFEIQMIREHFPKLDIPVLAGKTKAADAARTIEEWNQQLHRLLLCHPLSMSHGLNLQKGGRIVCWFGLTWSLEQYDQLIGRLNRRGQEHTVKVIHITANNTTDDAVLKALERKSTGQKHLLKTLHEYWESKKGD